MDISIQDFLVELGSDSPAPGGEVLQHWLGP